MAEKLNDINNYIAKSILANNTFEITEVNEIESINSFYFKPEHYREIEGLLKATDINAIRALPSNYSDTLQYYYVLKFRDQNNNPFAVTVYDSNELWQDPQVIEIFQI